MAKLTKVEAAIAMGIGLDLLEWFMKTCPKPGQTKKLVPETSHPEVLFDEAELDAFRIYLREPWPKPADGSRPAVPGKIKKDVKEEAHLACAICGHMDNGEVAHIEAVAKSYNNSPDNLIFLCPNHHTKYDLGFKPNSNVTIEEIRAAKQIKRCSRIRMMRVEADCTKAYATILDLIKKLETQINEAAHSPVSKVYLAEVKSLLKQSSKLSTSMRKASPSGTTGTVLQSHLNKHAPTINKLVAEGVAATSKRAIMSAVSSVLQESQEVIAALDEVECPHCLGRGVRGLVGDYCNYCHGSQMMPSGKAARYDPDAMDEQVCPHCEGHGTTGLIGDYCLYCHGSQFVSSARAAQYDASSIDEHPCPRCHGRGTIGLSGSFCPYCKGSAVVSEKKLSAYDEDSLDEVECPRCIGRGTTGLNGEVCVFCNGDQVVTSKKANKYRETEIDEVDCPHCDGRGTTGLNGKYCAYCRGNQQIPALKAEKYDKSEIDEVPCPHCEGRGTTGLVGDYCKLCKGDQVVTHAIWEQYRRRSRG